MNMDEISKLFTWPLVSLIFGIVFMYMFRSHIGGFISRIRSAGKDGVKLDETPDAQLEEQKKEIVQALMDIGSSQLRDEVEIIIFSDLKERNLDTEGDTVKILVRHLAATRMALDFEQIYSLIFGSQIYLLKKLNEVAGQGKSMSFVDGYFKQVKTIEPEFYQKWELSDYVEYLHSRSLVTQDASQVHITVKGQEFLVWLARSGRREDVVY